MIGIIIGAKKQRKKKIQKIGIIYQAKDNEIVALTKVKFDLEANLSFERSKKPQSPKTI